MARIKFTTLQYPKDQGEMAVPHSITYFMATQLQHLSGWDLLVVEDPSKTLWIPLKLFQVINSIFCSLIRHTELPRNQLEQLQRPKESGGLALPDLWLYYLAAHLKHIARALP